ncbi:MAG: DUF2085 domain-containing protein [Anaerolineaceae bacterium]|jgi:uncharacterized membrane protein
MRSLTLYYSDLPEQKQITKEIQILCDNLGVLFVDLCIDNNVELQRRFGKQAPVVLIGPYRLNSPFTLSEVEVAVKATLQQDENVSDPVDASRRFTMTRQEKLAMWFSKNYAWVISVIILVFLGFSALPPVLAANGNFGAANAGYKFYSFVCHQLAFRSYFIEGEQAVYPRELAQIPKLITYEEFTGQSSGDIVFARGLIGDEVMGYKLALCQRDVAIYAGLGLFGLFFHFSGRKIKNLRWIYWLIISVIPIAIDGGSQLPGLSAGWPAWLPNRESTPLLRTLTGGLFGLGTAWFVFPLMEESIRETRFSLERKLNISKRYSSRQ